MITTRNWRNRLASLINPSESLKPLFSCTAYQKGRLIESEATSLNDTFFQALAFDKELGATRGIDAALKLYKLDALVLPAPGFTTTPAGMYHCL